MGRNSNFLFFSFFVVVVLLKAISSWGWGSIWEGVGIYADKMSVEAR